MTKFLRLAATIIAATGGLSLALGGAPGPAVASGAAVPARAGRATDRASSTAGWRVAYRSTSTRSNQVYSVTALSASDAWAVGARAASGSVLQEEPLALQWNGQAWRSVTVPGVTGYYLPDVAASAKTNLWIFAVPGNGGDAKAVRWDGTQWQDIPLPAGVYPDDVAVLKPTDAWVVGPQQPCTGSGASQVCPTTLYHWDGSAWSPFTLPIVVDELSGSALAASGPNHVWVVGASHPCAASPCSYRVRVYSWNGSTWGRWKSFPRVDSYYLPAVALSSGRDAWVGTWSTTNSGHRGRLLHWNGSTWSTIGAPRSLTAPTGTPMVTDGRNGVWMGPWARWTGTHWRNAGVNAASACQLGALARIPGTTRLWGGGSVLRSQTGPIFDSVICGYPSVP